MRKLRRVGRWLAILFGLLLLIILLPLVGVLFECRPFTTVDLSKTVEATTATAAPPEAQPIKAGLHEYARLEDQTYLTLPEWYIVFSADEYAAFIEKNPPSHFPYFSAIGQYWQSYYGICRFTREQYAFNSDYHLMLVIIGASFTIENLGKGIYENSVGRVAEWFSSPELTPEDALARIVAKEYGTFIHTIPWFNFPFGEKLGQLWRETGWWGPNALRKWERKFALTLEYGGKMLYGSLLKVATESAYGAQATEILAVAEGVTDEVLKQNPQVHIVEPITEQTVLLAIPHYEAFTQIVPKLTAQGVRFLEIAGNDEILLTAFAPSDWEYDLPAGEALFAMPVLIQPGVNRVAINAPVPSLHLLLQEMTEQEIILEHLYDY